MEKRKRQRRRSRRSRRSREREEVQREKRHHRRRRMRSKSTSTGNVDGRKPKARPQSAPISPNRRPSRAKQLDDGERKSRIRPQSYHQFVMRPIMEQSNALTVNFVQGHVCARDVRRKCIGSRQLVAQKFAHHVSAVSVAGSETREQSPFIRAWREKRRKDHARDKLPQSMSALRHLPKTVRNHTNLSKLKVLDDHTRRHRERLRNLTPTLNTREQSTQLFRACRYSGDNRASYPKAARPQTSTGLRSRKQNTSEYLRPIYAQRQQLQQQQQQQQQQHRSRPQQNRRKSKEDRAIELYAEMSSIGGYYTPLTSSSTVQNTQRRKAKVEVGRRIAKSMSSSGSSSSSRRRRMGNYGLADAARNNGLFTGIRSSPSLGALSPIITGKGPTTSQHKPPALRI